VKHKLLEVMTFGDDQMRTRTDNAAHNFAVMRHVVLNLICLVPLKRKGGPKAQCLNTATSDNFHAQLSGLL
jgi:hypothetical protein